MLITKKFTLAGVAQAFSFVSLANFNRRVSALGLKNDDSSHTLTVTVGGTLGDGTVDLLPGEYIKIDGKDTEGNGQIDAISANGTGVLRMFACDDVEDLPALTGGPSTATVGVDGTTMEYTAGGLLKVMYDNATIGVGAGGLQVKDNGLDTAKFKDGAITGAKMTPAKASALAASADQVTGLVAGNTTAFATKKTINASRLQVGAKLRIRAAGILTTKGGGSAQTSGLLLSFGGTTIGVQTPTLNVAANDVFDLEAEVVIRSVGAGGKFAGVVNGYCGHDGIGAYKNARAVTVDGAIDTTIANDVQVKAVFAADASAGDIWDLNLLTVEEMGTAT